MQIVKKDSFRSQGSAINKTDDMYRVVVDMKRTEYPQFAKLVEGQKPTTNKPRAKSCRVCVGIRKGSPVYFTYCPGCGRYLGDKTSPVG